MLMMMIFVNVYDDDYCNNKHHGDQNIENITAYQGWRKKYRACFLNVQRQTLRPYMRMTHTFPYLAHTYVLLC